MTTQSFDTGSLTSVTSLQVAGTGGTGMLALGAQSGAPSAPASGVILYGDSSDRLTLLEPGTNKSCTIDVGSTTSLQVLTIPDASGIIILDTASQALTNKTITSSTNDVTAKSLFSATTTIDVSAATAPSSGQVLTATSSTAATWQTPTVSVTSTWVISNTLSVGINDDSTLTAGSWNTRRLNTLTNTTGATGITLVSNAIRIAVNGTYLVRAWAPACNFVFHKLRLFDSTNTATAIVGTSEQANGVTNSNAYLEGLLTVTVGGNPFLEYQLQHWIDFDSVGNSGLAAGANESEVYAVVTIQKLI